MATTFRVGVIDPRNPDAVVFATMLGKATPYQLAAEWRNEGFRACEWPVSSNPHEWDGVERIVPWHMVRYIEMGSKDDG